MDYDKEKARLLMELKTLESKQELAQRQQEKDKELIALVDHIIDNEIDIGTEVKNIAENRSQGLQFLMKQRFNKIVNLLEAKELIEARIKERGL